MQVCLLEKGSEIGAHILSGATIDPKALDELLPDWRDDGCPLAETPVTDNWHWHLTKKGKFPLPHIIQPPFMSNDGNYTGSLGNLCRWLAEKAEELEIEIFPGFPASEILYDDQGRVMGVATGDMGVAKDGSHKGDYQPGMELHGKYTVFCEGARGHLTKQLKAQFNLEADCEPQIYGLGIKELWDIDPGLASSRPRDPHAGLADVRKRQLGRRLPVSSGEQPGRARLCHRARLQEPLRFPVRGIPALEAASRDPPLSRRRQAGRLWRARNQRRRLAIGAQAVLPRRRAGGLFGGLRQRAAHQGHAHRDEERDARRRSDRRCHCR